MAISAGIGAHPFHSTVTLQDLLLTHLRSVFLYACSFSGWICPSATDCPVSPSHDSQTDYSPAVTIPRRYKRSYLSTYTRPGYRHGKPESSRGNKFSKDCRAGT
ncbi:hypothetical protein FH972_026653 [Carpinus fangiana]|uniref:Uncharacterized protein n=1 Tax=Carpinus fangiana TaxID=176857 RepID=A0A5N6L5J5_9ROSI|nr:hypothetical protein FH972_026653 [Carpinus fangiana]